MADPEKVSSDARVRLLVKNPSRPGAKDFVVEVPADTTLQGVKTKLQAEYEGKPPPERQTLIYAGRVLKEERAALSSILRLSDAEAAHTLHLVVKAAPESGRPQQASNSAALASGMAAAGPSAGPSAPATQPEPERRPDAARTGNGAAAHPQQQLPQQVAFSGAPWPASQPDPAILAAYNAALESLRARPPLPSLPPQPGQPGGGVGANAPPLPPFPHLTGLFGQPGGFPLLPTPLQAPQRMHSAPLPAGPNGVPRSLSPNSQAQAAAAQQGLGQRLPQLYAPALAYVPVSYVQSGAAQSQALPQQQQQQQPGTAAGPSGQQQSAFSAAAAAGPQPQPPGQQLPGQLPPGLLPYPHFAPLVPMLPFGLNPYQPPLPMPPGQAAPPFPPFLPPQLQQQLAAQQHALAAAAAQQQQQQIQPGPEAARAPAPGTPGNAPAAAAGAPAPGQQQVRVRLIRVNVKLLMQLGILALILYQPVFGTAEQNTSHAHFLKLAGTAAALFLLWPVVARDNALRRRLQRLLQPQQQQQPAAGGGGGARQPQAQQQAQPQPPGQQQQQQQQQAGGFLQEVQALVVGFFTSLLPGLHMNAEDAAAFAQAQQIIRAEEEAAAARQQAGGREHAD